MPIFDFKPVQISIYIEGNHSTCDKSTGMIHPYHWLNSAKVLAITIGGSEFIHVITSRTFIMFESLVKIPPSDTVPPAIGGLDADIKLVEL